MNNKQSTNSLEEFLYVLREHEIKTFSKFVCIRSQKAFTEEKFMPNENTKIHWNGAVPHINIGCRVYACHQGKDKNLYKKKRYAEKRDSKACRDHDFTERRKLAQPTKKLDCPVVINVYRVLALPRFKVTSKSKQNEGIESKKIHAAQEPKYEYAKDGHVSAVCNSNSVKNLKKRALTGESKAYKKKLVKFLSSFEEDIDEVEHSDVVDLECQGSKKKRLKNDSSLLSNGGEPENDDMKFGSNIEDLRTVSGDSTGLNDAKKLKSKKKKRLRSKNRSKNNLEDPLLNSGAEELEKNTTELQAGRLDADNIIPSNTTANASMIAESDILNYKNKKKRSKNKNKETLPKDISDSNDEELDDGKMEVDSKSGKPPVVVGCKSSIVSANGGSAFQSKSHQKLQAAKFRYLNEILYKSPGQEALSYFQENTDEFEDYHTGYQSQVSKWPVNPVDVIIEEISQMNEEAVIADLGCGEAKIAETFSERTVYSFDLIALKDCVTACDMAKVPLQSNSVDIAVFCLSLMGTNWKDYVRESHRILKIGALLKIAEIESRIDNVNLFIKNIESFGFSLESQDMSHKMFIFLNFKKTSKNKKKSKVPDVTLKPCLYKKR